MVKASRDFLLFRISVVLFVLGSLASVFNGLEEVVGLTTGCDGFVDSILDFLPVTNRAQQVVDDPEHGNIIVNTSHVAVTGRPTYV